MGSTKTPDDDLSGGGKRDITFAPLFLKTHPNIEVDFFDDATAIVQVQAQLVQAQALL